jgi:hypothetical protein
MSRSEDLERRSHASKLKWSSLLIINREVCLFESYLGSQISKSRPDPPFSFSFL